MTVIDIKRVREFCTDNIHALEDRNIFCARLSSRDIDGGLNFEEENMYYRIDEHGWMRKHVTEATIQPNSGKTITKERDVSECRLSDEELLRVLQENSDALVSFQKFEAQLLTMGFSVSE